MRILWQGFTDPVSQAPYVDRLRAYLNEIADPDVEFDFRGISPPDRHLHRVTEFRCAAQMVRGVLEVAGDYDAVIVGHFQDAGLYEARSVLDLPVVGLGESAMHYACTLGVRVGLVTIHPTFIPWHREQILRYRLEHRVIEVAAIETSVPEFMRAFESQEAYEDIVSQFRRSARPLLDRDVEVIIPAGGLPALLFARHHGFELDGAAVLNPTAVAAKQAEVAVKLHRLNGTMTSRRSTFALPTAEALDEVRDAIA